MIRVKTAYFVQPAAIAAKNETYLNAEKNTLIDMELLPQGLLVRVKGWKGGPFLIGHMNIRSMELYEAPAVDKREVQPNEVEVQTPAGPVTLTAKGVEMAIDAVAEPRKGKRKGAQP